MKLKREKLERKKAGETHCKKGSPMSEDEISNYIRRLAAMNFLVLLGIIII